MQPGYTPALRAANHEDAAFLAQITTMNKAVRDALLALARALPDDQQVGAFASSLSRDRNALWETWKQAVPKDLAVEVLKVREAHHAPAMHQAGATGVSDLKEE